MNLVKDNLPGGPISGIHYTLEQAGTLPKWGDGTTDPSHLDCEVTLDAEMFDASFRDGLTGFFARAFRRDPAERFDNAEEMLRAWRHLFERIEPPGTRADHKDEDQIRDCSPARPSTRRSPNWDWAREPSTPSIAPKF